MRLNLYYKRDIILISAICLCGWQAVKTGSRRDKSNWHSSIAMKFGFKSGRILMIATFCFSPGYFRGSQHYFHTSKAYLPLYKFCPSFCEISLRENTITIMAYSSAFIKQNNNFTKHTCGLIEKKAGGGCEI